MRRLSNPLFALLLAAASFACPRPGAAEPAHGPSNPVLAIPLDTLGFDPVAPRLLVTGATMFTLNFVDNTHLLLTYNTRGLIARLPDVEPGDDDRLINALLLELPSGKIVARTQWHTRDREQYLYPLAHGLFLVRIRNRLTIIDPVRGLASGEPFAEVPFLALNRRIVYIYTSPDADLLAVETVPLPKAGDDDAAMFAAASGVSTFDTDPARLTQIEIFRVTFDIQPGHAAHLSYRPAGKVAVRAPIHLPANADGFIDIAKESPRTWVFDFQSHAGQRLELAPFDTTCAPNPWFVSRSEFVALGCNGGDNRAIFSGFNLRGEQPWIQVLSGDQISPIVIGSPAAGRLAFSRILVAHNSYATFDSLTPDDLTAQEIQVLQHHDGRLLLKVSASPIQRTGQNFDLSPDGLNFTVIRNNKLEIYRLPELSKEDEKQIALAAQSAPEPNDARIQFTNPNAKPAPTAAEAGPATPGARPAFTVLPPLPPAPVQNSEDATPEGDGAPRPPPSLYGPDHPKPAKPQ